MKCIHNPNIPDSVMRCPDEVAHYFVTANNYVYCPKHIWRASGRKYLCHKLSHLPYELRVAIEQLWLNQNQ